MHASSATDDMVEDSPGASKDVHDNSGDTRTLEGGQEGREDSSGRIKAVGPPGKPMPIDEAYEACTSYRLIEVDDDGERLTMLPQYCCILSDLVEGQREGRVPEFYRNLFVDPRIRECLAVALGEDARYHDIGGVPRRYLGRN